VAMILAYGSVKWWGILTPQQCGGINRFVSIFAVPLLSFQFIAANNPYTMNFRFIAADVVSKLAVLLVLAIWVRFWRNGKLEWLITIFVLTTIPNTLVMGTPLLAAMYGAGPGDLTVQAVVLQCIIWYTLLLVLYEYRAAQILIRGQFPDTAASIISFKIDSDVISLDGRQPVLTEAEIGEDGKIHVKVRRSSVSLHSAHLQSGRSSLGLTSLADSRVRHSNLTGAEIYSLHSSVNLTPRHSNFTSSDVYSLQSSRGPTPRTSSFNEENSKDLHAYPKDVTAAGTITSPPRQFGPLGCGQAAGSNHAASRLSSWNTRQYSQPPDASSAADMAVPGYSSSCSGGVSGPGQEAAPPSCHQYPGSTITTTNTNRNVSNEQLQLKVYSPRAFEQITTKRMMDRPKAGQQRRSEVDENAKELHMFVWSANASPISESIAGAGSGQLHVFGGCEFNTSDYAREYDAKEVRILVHSHSDHHPTPNAGAYLENNTTVGPESEAREQLYDEEYNIHDDFIFENMEKFKSGVSDKDDPRLDKEFRSTSTAELTPKVEDLKAKGSSMPPQTVMFKLISVMTFRKLIRNPNTYSSLIGLVWSLISYRWNFQMPLLLHNSVHILSDAGLGMAMFSLGLFMGLQERLIVCGWPRAIYGMVLRFLFGPGAFAAASYLVGLRGVSLNVAIVQAALPQGIVPFVFAKEYNVHPDILSTAVIFGILVALPITLIYYILLGL
jgi:auxin efflux carrier family